MYGRCGEMFSSMHAEIDAVFRAQRILGATFERNLKKIKLYVLRVSAYGEKTMARPCVHCQIKLKETGLQPKNIYYTNHNGEWESLKEYDV